MSSQKPPIRDKNTDKLTNTEFNLEQCKEALRGDRIPDSLGTQAARTCVIRGIRHHHAFAKSPQVIHLCEETAVSFPKFSRARNARLIMSNEIPDEMAPSAQPYCIWYPDLASEESYREVAKKYPDMRYQVGRACAVAGFLELYHELDLLPDVSMAEEARESKIGGENSRAIYEAIMSAPCRYAVMDDNTRTVNVEYPMSPAFLNGDTTCYSDLRRMFEHRRWVCEPRSPTDDKEWYESDNGYLGWNIAEDYDIGVTLVRAADYDGDEEDSEDEDPVCTATEVAQLYKPLPLDLPSMEKDLLVLVAAYEGNIDRYSRLSRPTMNDTEVLCVVRGIYHHTMFARWWMDELKSNPGKLKKSPKGAEREIKTAINARRIMNNDISGTFESDEIPFCIWWPLLPRSGALEDLAKKCPAMKESIAIACILGDYKYLYPMVMEDIKPSWYLWKAAQHQPEPFYAEDLKKRAASLNINIFSNPGGYSMIGNKDPVFLSTDKEPTSDNLVCKVDHGMMDDISSFTAMYGTHLRAGELQRHVWASRELLRKVQFYSEGSTYSSEWLENEPLPDDAA
ncbi:hypothetical protein HYFRA_00012288 [Hymenoscyphus fraxineus]|uniref:Uncharacterized protein n=1 Tax=Hymenoscyphus fraxineus TaxID=746836 RepID=A0A9N9KZI5_9HELO|nr:hypothetical protein HYFRA_00012288 [Hymenoscyphus fraxineus]